MLIKPIFSNTPSGIDDALSKANIVENKRFLYLFVDRTEYENKTVTIGKCAQINVSVTKGDGDAFNTITNYDTIDTNVYFYDVFFQNTVVDIKNAIFTLTSAFGSRIVNDFDGKQTFQHNVGLYSKLICGNTEFIDMLDNDSEIAIVPPIYYTSAHMYLKEFDMYGILHVDSVLVYSGEELIDTGTSVSMMDIRNWDTMVLSLKEFLGESSLKTPVSILDVSNTMFPITARTNIQNSVFIYDTHDGVNIKGGFLPFQRYYIKEKIPELFGSIKHNIESVAKELEREYGPLRLFYVPQYSGDKVKLIFKDYAIDHQPLTYTKSNVDREYSITGVLSDFAERIDVS